VHILEKVVLKANKRNVIGKQVGALRQAGKLPAVLYGHHVDSTPIVLDAHETALTLSRLTSSSLVTISLDGKEYPTLVECLPQEIPERVVVDITGLAEIGDTIHVSDLKLPGEVEILTDPDEVIVSATAPKVEEVVEAAAEEEEAAEPEVVKGGKKEEEASGE
jgi:large subunit ribosomal protein L25